MLNGNEDIHYLLRVEDMEDEEAMDGHDWYKGVVFLMSEDLLCSNMALENVRM